MTGCPEGHPEKRPFKLATLSLMVSTDDPTDPDFGAWGEVNLAGSYSQEQIPKIVAMAQELFRKVLEQEPTVIEKPCTCGACSAAGGDRS